MQEAKEIKKFEFLNTLIKISGVATLYTGAFGLGFQKGLIWNTQLENLSGSYDVKEIFSSAVQGGIHVFELVSEANVFHDLDELLGIFVVSILTCLISGGFILLVNLASKKRNTFESIKSFFSIETFSIKKYLIFSLLFSIIIAPIVYLINAITKFIMIVVLLVLLGFSAIGFWAGESWLHTSIKNDPCIALTDKMKKAERVHQCTQLYFRGKKLMGEVILENSEGYIIKRNESFLYYSKDGTRCFYSKVILTNEKKYDISKEVNFSLVDPVITQFCSEGNTN